MWRCAWACVGVVTYARAMPADLKPYYYRHDTAAKWLWLDRDIDTETPRDTKDTVSYRWEYR